MNELALLFYRNFPCIIRAKETVEEILSRTDSTVFEKRIDGKLIAACVVRGNTVILLCVDKAYRGQGIGSELLRMAEEHVRAYSDKIRIGRGDCYLTPGVPTSDKQLPEDGLPENITAELDDTAAAFFRKRGYLHRDEGNIFDMRMDFDDTPVIDLTIPAEIGGVRYRFAKLDDLDGICACTDDADEGFTRYYRQEHRYTSENSRVLVAEIAGRIVGALMVENGTELPGFGSVGCTSVMHDFRRRGIATTMVKLGTEYLRKLGLRGGTLNYTYSEIASLYGRSGYRISVFYLMAEKTFA